MRGEVTYLLLLLCSVLAGITIPSSFDYDDVPQAFSESFTNKIPEYFIKFHQQDLWIFRQQDLWIFHQISSARLLNISPTRYLNITPAISVSEYSTKFHQPNRCHGQNRLLREIATDIQPVTKQTVCFENLQTTAPRSWDLVPIPTKLLYENRAVLPTITNIINTSPASDPVPPDFKTAIVKPLLKKTTTSLDHANLLKNYRLISNLQLLSKMSF